MLILRVAEGKVWQTDTMKAPESVIKSYTGNRTLSALRFDGGAIVYLEMLSSLHRPGLDEDSDEV